MSTFTHTDTFVVIDCCRCGVLFGVPEGLHREFRDDSNRWFYCPNGHQQHYGKEQKERARREHHERRAATFKGHVTRIKNRVGRGDCPCCNRHFDNLQRHMATKHPTWSPDEETPA